MIVILDWEFVTSVFEIRTVQIREFYEILKIRFITLQVTANQILRIRAALATAVENTFSAVRQLFNANSGQLTS